MLELTEGVVCWGDGSIVSRLMVWLWGFEGCGRGEVGR